jgi:hypothetical protein
MGSSLWVHRCVFTPWNSEACVPRGSSLRVHRLSRFIAARFIAARFIAARSGTIGTRGTIGTGRRRWRQHFSRGWRGCPGGVGQRLRSRCPTAPGGWGLGSLRRRLWSRGLRRRGGAAAAQARGWLPAQPSPAAQENRSSAIPQRLRFFAKIRIAPCFSRLLPLSLARRTILPGIKCTAMTDLYHCSEPGFLAAVLLRRNGYPLEPEGMASISPPQR